MPESEQVRSGKVIFRCHAGIDLTISALSFLGRNQLQRAAEKAHPYPDPKQYERPREEPVFGGSESDPGIVPASENPEYQALWRQAKADQDRYVNNAAFAICVTTPQKERLIELYADELAGMRLYGDALPESDWSAVIQYFLCSYDDLRDVVGPAISQSLPLTQEEVGEAGTTFFRIELRRTTPVGLGQKQGTSDIQSAEQNPA